MLVIEGKTIRNACCTLIPTIIILTMAVECLFSFSLME
jgi:hypothetical protein